MPVHMNCFECSCQSNVFISYVKSRLQAFSFRDWSVCETLLWHRKMASLRCSAPSPWSEKAPWWRGDVVILNFPRIQSPNRFKLPFTVSTNGTSIPSRLACVMKPYVSQIKRICVFGDEQGVIQYDLAFQKRALRGCVIFSFALEWSEHYVSHNGVREGSW